MYVAVRTPGRTSRADRPQRPRFEVQDFVGADAHRMSHRQLVFSQLTLSARVAILTHQGGAAVFALARLHPRELTSFTLQPIGAGSVRHACDRV
jgi:hypothetical protein